MFIDQAVITVQGGNGGNGATSWRREKYVSKGGPNGGDGGRGGDIILVTNVNTDTLSDYKSRKTFSAQNGESGKGKNMAGKSGEDLLLSVPPGTLVYAVLEDGSKELLVDLSAKNQEYTVALGGRGGFGNAHFTSSTRQRPDFSELGEKGEVLQLFLELKLVADVGIIGLPSVGKSSLISSISAAKPKIAAYEFTTLIPNLGVVSVYDRQYIVCDVPGLIEGASEGKGLGDKFLKHIERCGMLLHVLDLSHAMKDDEIVIETLVKDYEIIRNELAAYSSALAEKKELVVLNKVDVYSGDLTDVLYNLKQNNIQVFSTISVALHSGITELTKQLLPLVDEQRTLREQEEPVVESVVLQPLQESNAMNAYRISVLEDKVVVTGKRLEQLTAMTNFMSQGAIKRWRYIVEHIGLQKELQKHTDKPIFIGSTQVNEWL